MRTLRPGLRGKGKKRGWPLLKSLWPREEPGGAPVALTRGDTHCQSKKRWKLERGYPFPHREKVEKRFILESCKGGEALKSDQEDGDLKWGMLEGKGT